MARKKTKQIDFKIHDNMITQFFRRQAGSLWKAVVEGVMNSIDAQASRVDITINNTTVIITDDGRGFKSADDIETGFRTLGAPQAPGDSKPYGYFRLGRGQLFAYGQNIWRSGTFRMHVNINNTSKSFQLESNLSNKQGCEITLQLYRPLAHTQLADICDELVLNVKYVTVPVYINGKRIDKAPATQTWDIETEDADIKLKSRGNLVVYNQGIRVTDIRYHRYGTGGVVVSKKRLRVNFARNELMSDCPVWERIVKQLTVSGEHARNTRTRTQRITENDRVTLAHNIKYDNISSARQLDAKVFTNISGTHGTIFSVMRGCYNNQITLGDLDDRECGKCMLRDKLAYVLHPRTLRRFNVTTLNEFVGIMRDRFSVLCRALKIVSYASLHEAYVSEQRITPIAELTIKEQAIIAAFNNSIEWLAYCINQQLRTSVTGVAVSSDARANRDIKILMGTSSGVKLWYAAGTATQTICFNRDIFKHCKGDIRNIHYYCALLVNFIIENIVATQHYNSSVATVWQQHVLSSRMFASFVMCCFSHLPHCYAKLTHKTPRTVLKIADKVNAITARNAQIFNTEVTDTMAAPPAMPLERSE